IEALTEARAVGVAAPHRSSLANSPEKKWQQIDGLAQKARKTELLSWMPQSVSCAKKAMRPLRLVISLRRPNSSLNSYTTIFGKWMIYLSPYSGGFLTVT